MAGDGELNAHKRQPGDIPVVDKLLAAGAVSFRWTWSPAFGRHPESLESADHLGKLAASILARRPISRAIDPATKDCNGWCADPISSYYIVIFYLCLRAPDERLGGLEVYCQLKFCRQLNG
jgi:hypothetical protein